MGLLEALGEAIEEVEAEVAERGDEGSSAAQPTSAAATAPKHWGSMSGPLEESDDDEEQDDEEDDEVLEVAPVQRNEAFVVPVRQEEEEQVPIPVTGKKDFFGVVYRPRTKEDIEGREAPRGPAFEEEPEFERDLEASAFCLTKAVGLRSQADDDDEFDFEEAVPPADGPPPPPKHERSAASTPAPVKQHERSAVSVPASYDHRKDAQTALLATSSNYDKAPSYDTQSSIKGDLGNIAEEEEEEQSTAVSSEWDDFTVVTERSKCDLVAHKKLELTSYAEVVEQLRALKLEKASFASEIVPTAFSSSILQRLSQPSLKFPGSTEERDWPFLVAKLKYDPLEDLHWQLLCTIWCKLLDTESRPRMIGGHWEKIGFQGNDPKTDLNRSMCLLTLLGMLSLITGDLEFARKMHKCSLEADWPFACTAIKFTHESITCLRSGRLYKACNRERAVLPVLHDFQKKRFAELYDRIQNGEDRFEALNAMKGAKIPKKKKKQSLQEEDLNFNEIPEDQDDFSAIISQQPKARSSKYAS